jgi:hypothetical protein
LCGQMTTCYMVSISPLALGICSLKDTIKCGREDSLISQCYAYYMLVRGLMIQACSQMYSRMIYLNIPVCFYCYIYIFFLTL